MGLISKKAKTSAGRLFGVNVIYGAVGDHETPYMTRAWIGRLRFHVFHRGDQDPDCHDHPWGFWTFPLRSYVEEVLEERIRSVWGTDPKTNEPCRTQTTYFERRLVVVRAFRLHYRPASYRHRVLGALAKFPSYMNGEPVLAYHPVGAVPTIVFTEKPSRKWGFTKERDGTWCWVPWKTYVFDGGKDAPCSDEDI